MWLSWISVAIVDTPVSRWRGTIRGANLTSLRKRIATVSKWIIELKRVQERGKKKRQLSPFLKIGYGIEYREGFIEIKVTS